VKKQKLSTPVVCLGDGHDGIWNIFAEIGKPEERREILDWYHLHLVENLGTVGGSGQRLDVMESLLWESKVDLAIEQFQDWKHERVNTFVAYLRKHQHRIINYNYYQAEGVSIGSGAVESTIKQYGQRVKITGAQWKRKICHKSSGSAQLILMENFRNYLEYLYLLQDWDALVFNALIISIFTFNCTYRKQTCLNGLPSINIFKLSTLQ
jgi:hypothetical protein